LLCLETDCWHCMQYRSLTMGVMYWQLNDIWAGASWSSVDISGET